MSIIEIFGNMGPVGWTVIGFLMLLSFYSTTLTVEKYVRLRAARNQSRKFHESFSRFLKDDNIQSVQKSSERHEKSYLARVAGAGVREYNSNKASIADRDAQVEAIERALDRESFLTSADMKRGLGGLATIGSTAPFIGLTGTVMGIVSAFQGIATSGSGGLASVSSGIAEALITTAVGLFVAIPAVMSFNYFTGALERCHVEMTHASAELTDYFRKKMVMSNAG
jgi:biopolymer transport protein ExbB/TolQ